MNVMIRQLGKDTIDDQIELFNMVFSTSYNKEMWIHKHFNNPDNCECDIFGAYDETGKLIGINGFLRSLYQYNEEEYYVIQSCESAVHPDYRGKGIFSKIIRYALEESPYKDKNCYIIGFPNTANAYPGFVKMGWDTHTWLKEYTPFLDFISIKINRRIPSFNCGFVKKSYLFSESRKFIEYPFCATYKDKVCIIKKSNELSWRTFNNNNDNFVLCSAKNAEGHTLSYVLVKLSKRKETSIASIVDWGFAVDSDKEKKNLIKFLILNIRKRYGCVSIRVSENDYDYKVIKSLHFWEHKKARQPFIGKTVNPEGKLFENSLVWMPRLIDYDGVMF